MNIAISLIVIGAISVVIGIALGFSGLRKFAQTSRDGEFSSPFSGHFLLAMVFDALGGLAFLVGLVLLILQYV